MASRVDGLGGKPIHTEQDPKVDQGGREVDGRVNGLGGMGESMFIIILSVTRLPEM